MGWLSVVGLYTGDNTIFNGMYIPDGIDRDIVIKSILTETAELEVVLASPAHFKLALDVWSRKRRFTWDRIYKVLLQQYDPLENYNRTETRSIDREKVGVSATNTNDRTEERYTPDNTSTTSKTSYESGSPRVTEQVKDQGDNQTVTQLTGDIKGSTGEVEDTEERIKAFGNIGTMTSQQMLTAEVEVAQINLIDIIVEEFKEQFCVLVY